MYLKRKHLFGTTVLAGVIAVSAPAFAQTAPQNEQATEVGEIIVTGSLIRRNPTTSATPLIQASREEVLQSGEGNIVDFLADIPALQNSQTPEDTTGGFVGIGGLSLLNLRNLGADRTLVLVDGRRHVGGPQGSSAVDVDTIPTPLIERVEIITGGASALYGADAVSGVVNFIMRKDFEGLEVEAAVSQLAQDTGQFNQRISIIGGKNLFDDRLNVYGFAEFQTSDRINDNDLDIDWLNSNTRLQTVDVDPASAPNDGVWDIIPLGNLRTLNRPLGGILSLANGVQPSPASDPDVPFGNCSASQAVNAFSSGICFSSNPGKAYQFTADGKAYLADFGVGRATGAVNRTTTVGGSGDSLVFQEINRLPEQENQRYQIGSTFKILDNVEAFGELKYVSETNTDVFQPHFIDIGIRQFGATEQASLFTILAGEIGLDNAYLDPTVRQAIQTNRRDVYNSAGALVGNVADPRAQFRMFSYDLGMRPAVAEREITRFVGGFRGDFDKVAFVKDVNWELAYTYGKAESTTVEGETIDVERMLYSADAVRDVFNETGKGANAIVCRVQLLAARGVGVESQNDGSIYAANDPTIRDCVPSNIFGQGGQVAARDYILTSLTTVDLNEQTDVRGFVSGSLWDFWGAGPIGFALGGEYRKEATSQQLTPFGNRVIFGNTGDDRSKISYDVSEGFMELRVPVLKDVLFAESLEVSGAYRYSDYSTIGGTETYSLSAFWRPIQDIAFRATYGEAVRAPNLDELYASPFDTFPNLTDNCSSTVINATADARIRANRIANCAALGIPTTYVDPNPNSSNEGKDGSNPLLQAETSTSHTISAILTPRFMPGFSLVADYYDIEIENAISTLSAQTLLNLCTDEEVLNQSACNVFTRRPAGDPQEYEISDFFQGPFNFAGLRARGMDFQARYGFETSDLFDTDFGRIDLGLSGNYLIRRQNFTNPTDPSIATDIDKTANNPRVRFRTNATWTKGPLAVTWRVDVQMATIIVDRRQILANLDNRDSEYFTTGNFYQHDLTFAYDVNDKVAVRGGVVNLFDAEPSLQAGLQDQFDLFGRRFFGSVTFKY